MTVDAVEGLTEIGQRPGFGLQFADDGVGIAGELGEPVALGGNLPGDGFPDLGDLLIDPTHSAPTRSWRYQPLSGRHVIGQHRQRGPEFGVVHTGPILTVTRPVTLLRPA